MSVAVVVLKQDIPLTYRDYESWPDGERWELIDGVAYDMCAAPSRFHQEISTVIFGHFFIFFRGKPCRIYAAPFDVVLPAKDETDWRDSTTVVQPDLSVVCDLVKLTEQGCLGAPDLVVEIISPYTSKKDMNEKFNLYERMGVREYWVVFPGDRAVSVFVRSSAGKFDQERVFELAGRSPAATADSTVFSGLSVPLAELFGE